MEEPGKLLVTNEKVILLFQLGVNTDLTQRTLFKKKSCNKA
jgi:hypothetical protein